MAQEVVKLPTYETLLTEAIRSLSVDFGVVTSPAAQGTNILNDSTKNWAAGIHRNRLVKIIRGAGAGQQVVIDNNNAKSLVLRQSWAVALNTSSVYVILDIDIAQVLRDVFGGGADISAANPLRVFDPKVFGAVGDPPAGEDLATRIGYEGGISLADKLTAARAALIDQLGKWPGGESSGTHVHASNVDWQTVATILTNRRTEILAIWLDFVNLTQNMNMRLEYKIDGVNYTTFWRDTWTVADDDGVLINWPRAINNDIKLDLQSVVAEGESRDIPYCIIYREME